MQLQVPVRGPPQDRRAAQSGRAKAMRLATVAGMVLGLNPPDYACDSGTRPVAVCFLVVPLVAAEAVLPPSAPSTSP